MKYKMIFFLAIIMIFEHEIFSQANEFPINMYVTSEDGLNVRNTPSLNSTKITTLIFGELVTAYEKGSVATIDGMTDFWYRIFYSDGSLNNGWVFGGYLSKESPLYIIDRIVYSIDVLPENISFSSVNDYLGKWVLLDNEGNFHYSDSYFIIYLENGIYKFLTKYYSGLHIGIVTWTEYNGIVMNVNNRNRNNFYIPWSIVGKPSKKINTYVAFIDNEGPLGYFQRVLE
jgi:hypothetical protein